MFYIFHGGECCTICFARIFTYNVHANCKISILSSNRQIFRYKFCLEVAVVVSVEGDKCRIVAEIEALVEMVDDIEFQDLEPRLRGADHKRSGLGETVVGEIYGAQSGKWGEVKLLQRVVLQREDFKVFASGEIDGLDAAAVSHDHVEVRRLRIW